MLKYKRLKRNYYFKSFYLGLFISFLFLIPFIIYDKGYFLYYGDYNVQDVPFTQLLHDSLRNGNFFWSTTTDLGANIIGSYTFYFLTSPFFWITLPFPSEAVPYLMGPILILKLGCASLTAYVYIKRYVNNKDIAVLASLLYAFSGFSIYNIFFYHFHESIIIFPLVLASLDSFMYNKKRGLLALTMFVSSFLHYYFFVGQAIFLIIYWGIKVLSKHWKFNFKEFLNLIFEGILGIGISTIILLPTILAVVQNPRFSSCLNGIDMFVYSPKSRYIHILECFFFPPDNPARPNFTPNSNSKWSSVAAWLPLFGMTGVITWIKSKNTHWLKRLLILLFFISAIPILNSMFQLFNSEYYARWFYMLTLMMSLATALSLQSESVDWNGGIRWTWAITMFIALPIGLIPKNTEGRSNFKLGLMQYPMRFWIYVAISLISIFIVIVLIKYFDNKEKMIKLSIISVGFMSVVMSVIIISFGKSQSGYDSRNFIIPYCLNGRKNINLPDTNNCRIDVYKGMDNQAMFWQMPTIQAFHSIVPGSIMEFYPSIGVVRDVGSRPEIKFYGLRALTSCKWLFDYANDRNEFNSQDNEEYMPGWSYYDKQNSFHIWKNDYYIPYGFTYDKYITEKQYDLCNIYNRNLILLKAIVLNEEQISRHSDILKKTDNIFSFSYSEDEYYNDCKERAKLCCFYFENKNDGFNAKIDLTESNDQLVFFSVPFENGWRAKVNGSYVPVEKVNVGFMAVRVPGGMISDIEFNYFTPGLANGAIVSGIFLIIFFIYIFTIKKLKPKNKFTVIKYRPATKHDASLLDISKNLHYIKIK